MYTSNIFKKAPRLKIAPRLLAAIFLLSAAAIYQSPSRTLYARETQSARAAPKVRAVLNEKYLEEIIGLVKSSRRTIYICHFSWNPDTTTRLIKNAVYEAVERGVKVKILLEGSLQQNSYAVKEFSQLGVDIKASKREWYLHTKLVVVDSQKTLLGSTNLSYKSINENNEANVLIDSSKIARLYEKFFDAIWRDTTHIPGTHKEIKLEPVETPYAIAAPNRTYHPIMKEHIEWAQKDISLVFYGMRVYTGGQNEVMDFVDELEAAAKRGVRVRVLLEKSSYDERLNEGNKEAVEYLIARGIDARFDSPEKITHAKIILVDDEVAGVGSANFALSGFRFYQEANVVVKEPSAVADLRKYFDEIWKTTRPATVKSKSPTERQNR
ncbi:MAG: phospholipase D-like domain-containing protein [Endomicrobiia bacterium]|nr:phospholipase D-like domain-containing protein [Endomicrobiia bacterium]